jgi:hypothetical protein
MKKFFTLLCLCLSLSAEATPNASEQARIESLIQQVERQPQLVFIRNGKKYTAKQAAKFLRGKRDAHLDEIANREEFIAQLASRSSTTGKAYLIQYPDGKTVEAGQFWRSLP